MSQGEQLEAFEVLDAYAGDPLAPDLDTPTPRTIIAALTEEQRRQRVQALVQQSHAILDAAIETEGRGRALAATVMMWSGGNDSNTLAHVMRRRFTHAAMIDTTIGIEATRQFVRDQAAAWQLPMFEHQAPTTYENLVLERTPAHPNGRGFPGPAMHYMMYQRLKERGFRELPHDLDISGSRTDYVIFLGGRRREESERRKDVPEYEPVGTMLWVSPLVMWTKLDIITYRRMHADVPRNQVSELIHMSGECLCGAFAKPDELDEIGYWFPETVDYIRAIEAKADAQGIPAPYNRWGHGSNGNAKDAPKGRSLTCGPACEMRGQETLWDFPGTLT